MDSKGESNTDDRLKRSGGYIVRDHLHIVSVVLHIARVIPTQTTG